VGVGVGVGGGGGGGADDRILPWLISFTHLNSFPPFTFQNGKSSSSSKIPPSPRKGKVSSSTHDSP
jgi:hypothetical protein